MNGGKLFVRVVPQDRDRGYNLLVGWDRQLVQSTCTYMTSLSAVTRESLNKVIADAVKHYSASEVEDVTPTSIQKKLAKMFQETTNV